jgi:hypothetical protein
MGPIEGAFGVRVVYDLGALDSPGFGPLSVTSRRD